MRARSARRANCNRPPRSDAKAGSACWTLTLRRGRWTASGGLSVSHSPRRSEDHLALESVFAHCREAARIGERAAVDSCLSDDRLAESEFESLMRESLLDHWSSRPRQTRLRQTEALTALRMTHGTYWRQGCDPGQAIQEHGRRQRRLRPMWNDTERGASKGILATTSGYGKASLNSPWGSPLSCWTAAICLPVEGSMRGLTRRSCSRKTGWTPFHRGSPGSQDPSVECADILPTRSTTLDDVT